MAVACAADACHPLMIPVYSRTMVAVLFGLSVAVVTACAYTILSERMDYASVHRRQLDAWAAMAAVTCLVGILFGGAEARSAAQSVTRQGRLEPAGPAGAAAPIDRLGFPPLGGEGDAPSPAAAPAGAALPGAAPPPVAMPAAEPAPAERPERGRDAPASNAVVEPVAPQVEEAAPEVDLAPWLVPTVVTRRVDPSGLYVPVTPEPPATPAVSRVVIVTLAPPTPTPEPPTATAEPTLAPTVEPAPTAFCGPPNAMRLVLDVDGAQADRRSEPQGVSFRSTVRNDSAFPVSLTGLVITAQDSRSGADQFGSDRRQGAVEIAPGQSVSIDGVVKLDKFPSPFGRSELCVSFVAETCGRRSDQRPVTRRCTSISGF